MGERGVGTKNNGSITTEGQCIWGDGQQGCKGTGVMLRKGTGVRVGKAAGALGRWRKG